MKLWLLPAIAAALLTGGCASSNGSADGQPDVTLDSPDVKAVLKGNKAFACDLYGKLREQEGNLFFSPHSISTALAMTYGGARGNTADQMAKTLHFDLPPEKLHPALAAVRSQLIALEKSGGVKLAAANSLWPQQGYDISPRYLALCRDQYGAPITPVDFAAPEAASNTINAWVKEKTGGKIANLVEPDTFDAATRLVLVNAIYFKGEWEKKFQKSYTTSSPFYVRAKESVKAPLMEQHGEFYFASFDEVKVLELAYAGDELSMIVVLPHEIDGLPALEAKLTPENLATWIRSLARRETYVWLPKFKTSSEFSLEKALAILGMSDAFNAERADFSGVSGEQGLFLSAAIHKALVEVNEVGTEAKTVTITTETKSEQKEKPEPPAYFRADHPFLYLIRNSHTGEILFLGRVVDPTK